MYNEHTETNKVNKMKQYKTIALWGKEFGSYDYYILDQIERAKRDNAPADAIYEHNGVWVTLGEVENKELRIRLTTKLATM